MKSNAKAVVSLVLVALFFWGMVLLPEVEAGGLKRLSAQFRRFNVTFDSTLAAPSATPGAGGIQVYTKSFSIPTPKAGQQAVVFITMTGVGAQNDGTFVFFSCTIDSSFCNGGQEGLGVGAPAGWVNLMTEFDGSAQQYGVHYTWCAKVSPGTHTATLRMASAQNTKLVFLTTAHFFIDRTELKTSTADDCEAGAP